MVWKHPPNPAQVGSLCLLSALRRWGKLSLSVLWVAWEILLAFIRVSDSMRNHFSCVSRLSDASNDTTTIEEIFSGNIYNYCWQEGPLKNSHGLHIHRNVRFFIKVCSKEFLVYLYSPQGLKVFRFTRGKNGQNAGSPWYTLSWCWEQSDRK